MEKAKLKRVKKYGEVFTPKWLVEDMLDKLPEEVWTDSSKRWLEPACGYGVFLKAIKDRLMVGLKDEIPDYFTREKHIIQNMLFGCDIQLGCTIITRFLLNPLNMHRDNIKTGDFLNDELF